jgi:hypothetical protein
VDANDPIGMAIGSIGAGATAGACVITTSLIVFRVLAGIGGDLNQDAQFFIITIGLVGGLAAAITTTFMLTSSITDLWRRAAISGTTLFATAFLAVLSTPIDMATGTAGLTVYVVLLAAVALYAGAKAKAATTP